MIIKDVHVNSSNDGCKDYLKRIGNEEDYEEMSIVK